MAETADKMAPTMARLLPDQQASKLIRGGSSSLWAAKSPAAVSLGAKSLVEGNKNGARQGANSPGASARTARWRGEFVSSLSAEQLISREECGQLRAGIPAVSGGRVMAVAVLAG